MLIFLFTVFILSDIKMGNDHRFVHPGVWEFIHRHLGAEVDEKMMIMASLFRESKIVEYFAVLNNIIKSDRKNQKEQRL